MRGPKSSAPVYLALLHYPVVDKNGKTVATAVTNIDIHDLARSSRTYGLEGFFVATPIEALRALAHRIIDHWDTGFGATYNPNRKDALSIVRMAPDLDGVILDIEKEAGEKPVVVVTSARRSPNSVGFEEYRAGLARVDRPQLLVLGTGWGLAPEVMERADLRLDPIEGAGEYNHLSVRAAGAIILDRLLGAR